MAKIMWEGNQEWDKAFPEVTIPSKAKKLEMPSDILKASLPYGILPMLLCFTCVFCKRTISSEFLFDLRFMPLSLLIGFLLIPLHEFLHAICYPSDAIVYIGVSLKKLAAYAISFYPISKVRFIMMSLMPVLLGIIPMLVFILAPASQSILLTLSMAPMFMGMISPSPDYMIVILVLKHVPNGTMIQAANDGLYWFKSN